MWISEHFGHAGWRVSSQGAITARIATGLQPEAVYPAFGSVWVAVHRGHSVTRIDPAPNRVIANDTAGDPTQFRNGPQNRAGDGHDLYVGSSNVDARQKINPATDTTTTPSGTADRFCESRTSYLVGTS